MPQSSLFLLLVLPLASLGCHQKCHVEPVATLSPFTPTVVTISWESPDTPDDLFVDFGPDEDYGRTVSATATTEGYEVVLRGLKASTDYHWRAVGTWDGETCETDDSTITTGPLPPEVPTLTRTDFGLPSQLTGYMLTGTTSGIFYPQIFDADGDVVWWTKPGENGRFTTRVRVSRDLSAILYNVFIFGPDAEGEPNEARYSKLMRVKWDGTGLESFDTPGGHHDFLELPDGTLAYVAGEVREVEGTNYRGDMIMELSPDGTTRTFWSAWDHVASKESPDGWPIESIPDANTLDYDEQEDTYYLGLRNNDSLLKIPRGTAEVAWSLGGILNDFALTGDGSLFHKQHQFEITEGGVMIFDNGEQEDLSSRVVEYALDLSAMTVEQTWTWQTDPPLYTYSMGDVSILPDGNALVTWGTQGQIDEVSPDGQSVTRFNLGLGTGATYVEVVESLDG